MFSKLKTSLVLGICTLFLYNGPAIAYPLYAQQNYKEPREATGRIVCANCHLAKKTTDLEVPHEVFPNTVFEAVVRVPYDTSLKQPLGNGKKGGLNVGAILIFPDGFELAPADQIPEPMKARTNGLFYQPYSPEQTNMFVIGPVPGKKNQEIVFPVLSPDPGTNSNVHFLKYPVYVGGNRGRGQIYPDGSKSNNNVFTAESAGTITEITTLTKQDIKDEKTQKVGDRILTIDSSKTVIPAGPDLLVKVGDKVSMDEQITNNPNVGGFGQTESEIVLQNPTRLKGLIIFFISIFIAQVFLVLKKKQFEKVQLSEMNF